MKGLHRNEVPLALEFLHRRDPQLSRIIAAVGPFRMKRQTNRYQALLQSIVSQQISTASARAIWGRLEGAAGTSTLTADVIQSLTDVELRGVGLSPQKVRYVRDLTDRVSTGELKLAGLHRYTDEEVIAALIQVKGIGVWTAQMFLMFSLWRPDVLPHGDLGIQTAMKRLYGLDALPRREECHRIAEPWRPYATVACWYLWRSLNPVS